MGMIKFIFGGLLVVASIVFGIAVFIGTLMAGELWMVVLYGGITLVMFLVGVYLMIRR